MQLAASEVRAVMIVKPEVSDLRVTERNEPQCA